MNERPIGPVSAGGFFVFSQQVSSTGSWDQCSWAPVPSEETLKKAKADANRWRKAVRKAKSFEVSVPEPRCPLCRKQGTMSDSLSVSEHGLCEWCVLFSSGAFGYIRTFEAPSLNASVEAGKAGQAQSAHVHVLLGRIAALETLVAGLAKDPHYRLDVLVKGLSALGSK